MDTITYCSHPSPLGELLLATTERGLCLVGFEMPEVPQRLIARHAPRVREDTGALRDVRDQLDEYFGGDRRDFEVALDLSHLSQFCRRVLTALTEVAFGELTSYGSLAVRLGTASRAVGGAVGSNPLPIVVPCHRVVAADDSLGGYSGGLHRKRALLALEGRDGLDGGWPSRRAKKLAVLA